MVHSKEDLSLLATRLCGTIHLKEKTKRLQRLPLNWSRLRMMPTFSSPADLEICKIQQKQMLRRGLNTHKKS